MPPDPSPAAVRVQFVDTLSARTLLYATGGAATCVYLNAARWAALPRRDRRRTLGALAGRGPPPAAAWHWTGRQAPTAPLARPGRSDG
jgi:hypothetical protein